MTDLGADRPSLSGRYALGDVIGQGGMGVVHRAWDLHLQRYVAVKILRGMAMDPVSRARFRAEGQTLARLNHPGLITLLDAETDGDEPYLVMELVDGESLTGMCRGTRMDVGEVTVLGVALAEALDHVHRRRIIHRDITPSNVLIGRDGRVKLADFGVARLLDGISGHTATGMMLGTAGYVSPEQVRSEPLTAASDIYSLGLVLIEALAGAPAFVGSWDVVALARLTMSPPIDESLPAPLRDLLALMTATDPAERPDAAEVATTMRAMSGGATPVMVPGPRLDQPIDLEYSAEVPTVPGLEDSTDPRTSSTLEPVPSTDSASPASRSRWAWGALIAAVILVPAMALESKIDWADGPGTDGSSITQPAAPRATRSAVGAAAARSATRPTAETAGPAGPKADPTGRPVIPGSVATINSSPDPLADEPSADASSATETAQAPPTAIATTQTAAEKREAAKAARVAARESRKAARAAKKAN